MCGIAGFFFVDPISSQEATEAIGRCLRSLHHRGPDGQGWVLFTDAGPIDSHSEVAVPRDCKVFGAMIHTRLKIIDLTERAQQPMGASSNRYWLVYNGEVYNYREIRQELQALGWDFASDSDTEVVLKSYLQWGHRCLDKFRGMFGLAIYDQADHTLFCARDVIGIKPLYYHKSRNSFLFASDVTTLIASGFYTPEPDWNAICLGIAFQGAPRPKTVYRDVAALEPGHYLSGPAAGPKQDVTYWELPVGQILDVPESKALEQYEFLVRQAIKRCLVSDVEVGTLMSGGIDSTTMTVIAAQQHPAIRAFTLAYDQALDGTAELEQAYATASMHGLQHTVTRFCREELVTATDEMLWTFEEPIGALEPHYPIAKQISEQGIKVILNGLGPDELLGGYGYYRHLQEHWPWARRLRLLAPFIPHRGRLATVARLMECSGPLDIFRRFFASYLYEDPAELFEPGYLLEGSSDPRREVRERCPEVKMFSDDFQALSYADMKFYIGTHHNHTTDRFLMRFHVEGRFPYLDRDLVEFCFRLPADYKWRPDQPKYLLRKLAEKHIHPSCLSMKKKGFSIPETEFIMGPLEHHLKERIRALRERRIFKDSVLQAVLDDTSQTTRAKRRILYFANFELWYTWFIERQHPLFNKASLHHLPLSQ